MKQELEHILDRLEKLVAVDTRNPPRDMDAAHPIVSAVSEGFAKENIHVHDLGEGCVQILLKRGTPSTLINVHVDTVPYADGWARCAFELHRAETRAYGLGACDIKGAAACAIVAAQASDADFAILFTTDEENGKGRCVEEFANRAHGFSNVIVCEPTGGKAIFAHRGLGAFQLEFAGTSMHSSEWAALENSAIHRAGRWIAAACAYADELRQLGGDLPGICLNCGRIEGGIKPNICAPNCSLSFGIRPGLGFEPNAVGATLRKLCPDEHLATFETIYTSPALDQNGQALIQAQNLAKTLGIETGDPVNFWTEAALFAAAGLPAFVYGPGDIAQAHAVDEWVSYDQLIEVYSVFRKVFETNA